MLKEIDHEQDTDQEYVEPAVLPEIVRSAM